MTALQELESREKEIKGLLELSESLDERKALRTELREIRRKLFDAPPSTITKKQLEKTGITKDTNSGIKQKETAVPNKTASISIDTEKMSSRSNRFQKIDDNNNSTATEERRISSTSRSRESIGTNNNNNQTNNKNDSTNAKELSPNETKRRVHVSLNKPNEASEEKKTAVTLKTNSSSLHVQSDEQNTSTGIRRTATWAHKNRNTVASKFENASTNKEKSKYGTQVGQSPFQFGIDYRQRQKAGSSDAHKCTPTQNTITHKQKAEKEKASTPLHAQCNDSPSTDAKPLAVSKYIASISNKKTQQDSNVKSPNGSNSASYLGLSFATKSGNKDLVKKFESTNTESKRSLPSFNKYAAALNRTNDKNQAAKNIVRSFSLRVRPTYETSARPVQPSIDFSTKHRHNTVLNSKDTGKIDNATNSNNASRNSDNQTVTASSKTSSILNKRMASVSSSQRINVEPQPPTNPPKKTPESTEPSAQNPLAAFGGGGATDRMAFFRQAAQKEKEAAEKKKEREEQRRKQLETMTALVNGELANSTEKDNEADKGEETKTPTRKESAKKEIPDSEKMRNASAPCMKKREKKKVVRRTMSIGNIVLDWVQEMIKDYPVEVTNFSSSWNNGMAFCALIHHFNPDAFDFSELKPENKRHNFDLAFKTGMEAKNIPILLDTEDMVVMKKPEPRSVQTYIQWIWSVYGPTSGYGPTPQEVQK